MDSQKLGLGYVRELFEKKICSIKTLFLSKKKLCNTAALIEDCNFFTASLNISNANVISVDKNCVLAFMLCTVSYIIISHHLSCSLFFDKAYYTKYSVKKVYDTSCITWVVIQCLCSAHGEKGLIQCYFFKEKTFL